MLIEKSVNQLIGVHSGKFLKPLNTINLKFLEDAYNNTLKLSDFEPLDVDLLGDYNSSITSNRTWWFRFNQLPTLNWASGLWCEGEGTERYIDFNFSVIENWHLKSDELVPLKWHDHASAIRAKNLTNWFITVSNFTDNYSKELEKLAAIIETHLVWLCNEKNYSKKTNHGFEQARLMISVAAELPGLPSANYALRLGLQRLQDEISFAFTAQGVHKENSPGYQWFMIKVLQEAKEMLDGYGLELPDVNFDKLISRAKKFLFAIALPDNTLPLIGDTQHKENQNDYISKITKNRKEPEGLSLFDYSKSGYFIVKHKSRQAGRTQLIFKNSHNSDYHRHNDDLSIYVTYDDILIFGDSGLYSHNKEDIGRKFVKSSWAHSTVFPLDMAESTTRLKNLQKKPDIQFLNQSSVVGNTGYFLPEFSIQRLLVWSENSDFLNFKIEDRVVLHNSASGQMVSSFLIPLDIDDVTHAEDLGVVSLNYGKVRLSIEYDVDVAKVGLVRGKEVLDRDLKKNAFISGKMKRIDVATRVDFYWQASSKENVLNFNFS